MYRVEPIQPIHKMQNNLFRFPFFDKKKVTKKEEEPKRKVSTDGVIIEISSREERYPLLLDVMIKEYFVKFYLVRNNEEELQQKYEEEKQQIEKEYSNNEELFEVSQEAIEIAYKRFKK